MKRPKPVIAIDGPSGAGKSTVARGLAQELGFDFIDTGAMYRAIAKLADQNNISWEDAPALASLLSSHNFTFDSNGNLAINGALIGNSIRTSHFSEGASAVAQHKKVRDALVVIQRKIGEKGGVVLEGRDIGTVIFKDAEMKFYLVASVKTRALRRHAELVAKGEKISLEQVEIDQTKRDKADTERKNSPLRKASDAKEINCTDLSASQVINLMKSIVTTKFSLTST